MSTTSRKNNPQSTSVKQSDIAYVSFKKVLLSGGIDFGATLTQSELAKIINVPISPLRYALNKLESEGLVKILPRSGIKIIKPDLTLIRDCFQIRSMIEMQGLKSYIRIAADEEIEALITKGNEILQKIEDTRKLDDVLVNEAFSLDNHIHSQLVEALNNPIISSFYEMNNERIRLIRYDRKSAVTTILLKETIEEHLPFLIAIQRREQQPALDGLSSHLAGSMRRAMGL